MNIIFYSKAGNDEEITHSKPGWKWLHEQALPRRKVYP